MAQIEASLMIAFFIFLFVGIVFWRACSLIAKHIEAQNYERERFCLLVAQELDRLEKAIQENEKAKDESFIQPYKDIWGMRN
jgi:hypothetical protein